MGSDPNPILGDMAEATIAAAAFVRREFWDHVERLPDPEDFEDEMLGALWAGILAARKRGAVSRAAVAFQLREMQFQEEDCFSALARVRTDFLSLHDIVAAAGFMHDRKLRKGAAALCAESVSGLATVQNVREHVEKLERSLNDLVTHHQGASGFKAAFACDIRKDLFRGGAAQRRIATGWADIDQKVRGWPRGKVSIIAARPSMGKSAFAVCAARRLAEQGRGVGFISMEMGEDEIWARLASDMAYSNGAGPEYEAVMNGKANPIQIRQMEDAADRARHLPLAINDTSALKVADIHRWARRLDREFRNGGRQLDALIVDYLQLARPDKNRNGNKVQEVTDISADLLAVAKEMDVAIIALSQLSRAPEQRGNPRPQLSDLRDSGSLEQDADMVGMLFRPAYYLERKAREEELSPDEIREAAAKKHRLEIDWQKNRNGKTGIVPLFCDIGRNAVGDLAPEYRSAAA